MRYFLALVVALYATSTAAAPGDKGAGVPPAPKSTSVEDVKVWTTRYIDDEGWAVAANTDDAVFLLSPTTVEATKNGTIKYWFRVEYFTAQFDDSRITRSAKMLHEVDCKDERFRLLALDSYPQNSQGGEENASVDEPDATWQFPRPGTVAQMMTKEVCEYIDNLAKEASEEGDAKNVRDHF